MASHVTGQADAAPAALRRNLPHHPPRYMARRRAGGHRRVPRGAAVVSRHRRHLRRPAHLGPDGRGHRWAGGRRALRVVADGEWPGGRTRPGGAAGHSAGGRLRAAVAGGRPRRRAATRPGRVAGRHGGVLRAVLGDQGHARRYRHHADPEAGAARPWLRPRRRRRHVVHRVVGQYDAQHAGRGSAAGAAGGGAGGAAGRGADAVVASLALCPRAPAAGAAGRRRRRAWPERAAAPVLARACRARHAPGVAADDRDWRPAAAAGPARLERAGQPGGLAAGPRHRAGGEPRVAAQPRGHPQARSAAHAMRRSTAS